MSYVISVRFRSISPQAPLPVKKVFVFLRHGNEQRQKVAVKLKKACSNTQQLCAGYR